MFWRICNPPKSNIRICNPLKSHCQDINVWACADCKSAIRNRRIANPAEQMLCVLADICVSADCNPVFWRICNPPKSIIRICNPLNPHSHEINVWACADYKSALRNRRIANPAEQMGGHNEPKVSVKLIMSLQRMSPYTKLTLKCN